MMKRQRLQNQQNQSYLQNQQRNSNKTSWGDVSTWYDNLINDKDNYQRNVILPNFLRIFKDIHKTDYRVLDIGSGQGFFINQLSILFKNLNVEGIEISKELIDIAKEQNTNILFHNLSAENMSNISDKQYDIVYSILAIQNMKNIENVLNEIKRVLKPNSKTILIINHPCFRIPKDSDWIYDTGHRGQGRVVFKYMSDKEITIDMNPGEYDKSKKRYTYSYHHSLQYYTKIFFKLNFKILKIEEWITHKKSEGNKAREENQAKQEIPMFMMLLLEN